MGYGGTTYSTVSVDIVQTDVDAIIQGLTGYAGRTFSDVDDRLYYMLDYLSGNNYGPLTSMADAAWQCRDYLSGYSYGPIADTAWNTGSARDYLSGYNYGPLTDIRDSLWADGYNAAWWLREIQYRGSDILSYLSGGWNGPLTDTAWNTSDIRNYLSGYNYGPISDTAYATWGIRDLLSGYNYGPLTDMRDQLYYIEGYLWSGYWGQSAADLLGDIRGHIEAIRWQTDRLNFDGNGRLLVNTN